MKLVESIKEFINQSKRVLLVTHKPQSHEYRHIATSTAIGMVIIGLIGFAIAMITHLIKGG